MQWVTIIAGYFVVWWIVLFAVLPFGIRPDPNADPVTGWRGDHQRLGQLSQRGFCDTMTY